MPSDEIIGAFEHTIQLKVVSEEEFRHHIKCADDDSVLTATMDWILHPMFLEYCVALFASSAVNNKTTTINIKYDSKHRPTRIDGMTPAVMAFVMSCVSHNPLILV